MRAIEFNLAAYIRAVFFCMIKDQAFKFDVTDNIYKNVHDIVCLLIGKDRRKCMTWSYYQHYISATYLLSLCIDISTMFM